MRNFDVQATTLIFALRDEAEALGTGRINSVMILKELLEAKDSPLYEAIFKRQLEPQMYSEFIDLCYEGCFERVYIGSKASPQFNVQKKWKIIKKPPANVEEKEKYPEIKFELNGKQYSMTFDTDVKGIFKCLNDESGEVIGTLDITKALIKAMPKSVLNIFRSFGVDTAKLQEYFSGNGDDISKVNDVIPEELKSFVRDLTEEFKGRMSDISGRDKECEFLWQTLQKQTKRNAILVGEPGVGKTSVVYKIVYDIIEGNCPEEFKNARVLSMDVNASVAGTMYRGQSEQRYAELTKFLEKTKNVILFIDEIHLIRGAGACKDGEADLANAIKPILSGNHVRVIGATTKDEYEKYFSQDGAIKRRFRPIEVKEPKSTEVFSMLEKSIATLSNFHGVSISREMVDFIILNSACFNYETKNPDRTKDLIDLSMVVAKKLGKKEVDKDCVLANFKVNFEQFSKMSVSNKKKIAYHEAGHCVVRMCSSHTKHLKVIAVSIMPTDSYLGITVYEENNAVTPDGSMDFHIDNIAGILAGRVAESFYTARLSSGASSDLESATKEAYALVSEYGMSAFGRNRVVLPEVNSEKVKNKANKEINKIISKALKRAKKIIIDNYDFFNAVVDRLTENGILSEVELKELWEAYK